MNSIPYKCFSSFILRTPLLPFSYYQSLFGKKYTDIDHLKKKFKSPVLHDAIFLASPDLYNEMIRWLNDELTDPKETERLIYSLSKYLFRMSSRCTPFGLFSGCSVVNIGEKTRIEIDKSDSYKKHTRLDMNYLCAVAQDLVKMPQIKKYIKYYPNNSIYRSGFHYRYVEYRYQQAGKKHYMVSIDRSDYLDTILEAAMEGAMYHELANSIISDDITTEDSYFFIDELIESQVIVSELEPAVTGPEFLDQIIEIIDQVPDIENISQKLKSIRKDLQMIDEMKPGIEIKKYYQLADKIKELGTQYELKFLFQSDMNKPLKQDKIGKELIQTVMEGLEILNHLSPYFENQDLKTFKEAFYERYEEEEVDLSLALDIESGIGYGPSLQNSDIISPLVDDLVLPHEDQQTTLALNKIEAFLIKKYNESIKTEALNIELTKKDVADLEISWDRTGSTIYSMVQVSDSKESKILMENAGGFRASNLLGRFCHTDPQIYNHVKELINKEEEADPEYIFAEIAHLPESRTGNILLRPVLRKYEIPYLSKSYLDKEQQIPINDLTVCVRDNQIILRSKKLNKKINPCLTSAHNYSNNSLPIYHFLCDLQSQNKHTALYFHWGQLSDHYDFLPRVSYKNLIFSLAAWKVKKEEINQFLKISDDDKLLEAIINWRNKRKIPKFALLSEGDNQLLLNLDNILCVKILLSEVKRKAFFILKEFIFDPEDPFIINNEGNFTNELILTFYKDKTI